MKIEKKIQKDKIINKMQIMQQTHQAKKKKVEDFQGEIR